MENRFLLSIIIPTKNRQEYAIKAVEQILQINDNRLQIVIQDNSDTQILSEMLAAFNEDDHIIYNYTEGIISFVDNFSLAVSLSDGEYICIIGDDDGVVPQIVDVVDWAKKNSIDAIKPALNAMYYWPNSESVKNESDDGNMIIHKITCKSRIINPHKEIVKLLHNGCQKYLSLSLVKLYHGIVKKEMLDNIREVTGKYFGGLSPDIYIAVALSLTVDKLIEIDFPLTISGVCNKSGSADSATGKHTGKLEDAPHFRGHDGYNWSRLVPRFYSVETIWADSALAAICDLNKMELLKEFDINAFTEYCIKKHPQFKEIILTHYKIISLKYSNTKILVVYMKSAALDFFRRFIRKIKRRKTDIVNINGIENILIAGDNLQKRLNDKSIDVKVVLNSLENTLKRYDKN